MFSKIVVSSSLKERRLWLAAATAVAAMTALVCVSQPSIADEGGVSFWLPGIYGSLAAAPQQPGWSLATIYYHTSVSAFGNTAAAREAGVVTPLGSLVAQLMASALANGEGGLDHSALLLGVERLSGKEGGSDQ